MSMPSGMGVSRIHQFECADGCTLEKPGCKPGKHVNDKALGHAKIDSGHAQDRAETWVPQYLLRRGMLTVDVEVFAATITETIFPAHASGIPARFITRQLVRGLMKHVSGNSCYNNCKQD